MKRISTVLAAGAAFFLTSNAMAASYSYVCNACTTAQTREMVQGSRTGNYFVYDMTNRRITQWIVGTGRDIDHLPITPVAISPAVQNQFNYVQSLFDVAHKLDIDLSFIMPSMPKVTSISAIRDTTTYNATTSAFATGTDNRMSAFDLINTPANQQAAINAMQNQAGWLSSAPSPLQTALATFVSHFRVTQLIYPVPVVIRVTLQFPDGSTSRVVWNIDTNQWEYARGASRDAVGNPIPENQDQAVGGTANNQRYIFRSNPEGVNAALRQSQNFDNIGLRVGIPVFRNGSTWTVACVRVGGVNGTVNCTSSPSM